MTRVIKSGDAANSDSFSIRVVDACGDQFCVSFCTNTEELLQSSVKHAQWWIRYRTRPNSHNDKDSLGRRIFGPVLPAQIRVEFYNAADIPQY